MEYKNIIVETKDFITTIILNRPPANSVNMAVREELNHAVDTLKDDKNTRVVVITGAGEKGFCAGMDIADASNYDKGPSGPSILDKIYEFPKPVIAAINGFCLGGGLELALACHIRFMVDNPKAVTGFPEVNLGLTPGWGGIQRAPLVIGRAKAVDLILSCKRISGKEALEIGLIDRLCSEGTLMAEVMEYAGMLAKRAPIAVRAVLEGMMVGFEKGIKEGQKFDFAYGAKLGASKDYAEGVKAFAEKREPVFTGE